MRIALILTPFDQLNAVGFSQSSVKRVYGYSMPLGIAYLAAELEYTGHKVFVLDPCPQRLSIKAIVAWLESKQVDVVGISAMTHVVANAYSLANGIRERIPALPILLGGSHCNVFPQDVLEQCPAIDVVVIGEAEDRISKIVVAAATGKDLGLILGIVYREQGTGAHRFTGLAPIQKDLDSLRFPARHLFDHSWYIPFPDQIRKTPVANILTSRGCPWRKCKFCFEGGKFMPQYRRRSPENVINEIHVIRKMGFNGIAIWDDNFCISEKWVGRFCHLLRESKLDITWSCYGRVNTVNENMLRDLKSAGCFSIYFGFESGNQETLDAIWKGTTLDQARSAVSLCRKMGIEVRGSFILGLPGDTPELAEITIRFARELDLDSIKFMLYTPEEGTELYEDAIKSGTIIPTGFLGSLSHATYLPNGYTSISQLESIAVRANRSYILRPKFILRKIASIRSCQDVRKYYDGLRMILSLRNT